MRHWTSSAFQIQNCFLFILALFCKVKIKVTLVQALRLCTGHTAYRGSRGIALLFHDHCTRRGWGVRVTPRPLFNPGKDPVPIVQEVVWVPGPVWTGAENLAPTGIWSPDRPVHSLSLYRLSYPAHPLFCTKYSDTERQSQFIRNEALLLLLVNRNS